MKGDTAIWINNREDASSDRFNHGIAKLLQPQIFDVRSRNGFTYHPFDTAGSSTATGVEQDSQWVSTIGSSILPMSCKHFFVTNFLVNFKTPG